MRLPPELPNAGLRMPETELLPAADLMIGAVMGRAMDLAAGAGMTGAAVATGAETGAGAGAGAAVGVGALACCDRGVVGTEELGFFTGCSEAKASAAPSS